MRNFFKPKSVVGPTFADAMERLGDRTAGIRAFDLVQEHKQLQRSQAAASPNVVEMQRYGVDFPNELWFENVDIEKFYAVARALGKTSSAMRIIPASPERPYDYEAEEVI